MNSKSIGECEFCGELYCMECSDAMEYAKFCSKLHEDSQQELTEQEKGENPCDS